MELIKEFLRYFMEKKSYWLLPVIIVIVLIATLFLVASGSVVAPFIYSLF